MDILISDANKMARNRKTPMTTGDARELIRKSFSDLTAANQYDSDQDACLHRQNIMRQLQNIDQSIVNSGLRYLPKEAAVILAEVATESFNACVQDAEIIGGFDISANQRRMNELKQIPITSAYALLGGGVKVIDNAISAAKQPWYKPDLPGETARKLCADKLKWHAENLAKVKASETFYSSGDDLKKWVMQAFIEANAVEEGAAYIEGAWNQMWEDIKENIKQLPAEVRKQVGELSGGIFEWLTGIPIWVPIVAGTGLLGLMFYWRFGPRSSQ